MFRLPQHLSVISLSLFLAACGGGGDTNSSGNPGTTSTTGSSGTTATTGTTGTTGPTGASGPSGTTGSSGTGTPASTDTAASPSTGSGSSSTESAPVLASRWSVKAIPHAHSSLGTYYQDVNDAGDAVSAYILSNASGGNLQEGVGIAYADGRLVDLGTLQWATARGVAINNVGQLAIVARDQITLPPGTTPYINISNSYIYTNGNLTSIPAPSFSGSDTVNKSVFAQEMNDSGKVVGYTYSYYKTSTGTSPYRAFVYANGTSSDIPLLAGASASRANSISNSDIIVGDADFPNGTTRAFIDRSGIQNDLGTLPGFTSSTAAAVNDSGQVAGTAYNSSTRVLSLSRNNNPRPFFFSNGVMTAIPLPPGRDLGEARSLNNQGQVVGWMFSQAANGYPYDGGFLYSGGKTIDLNQLPEVIAAGIHITGAEAINNNGQILALDDSTSPIKYYLLTPVQ